MRREFVRFAYRFLFTLLLAPPIAFGQVTPPTIVAGPIGDVILQTGLFPQNVRVTNPGATDYPGIRIFVLDLPRDTDTNIVRVANAHGTTNNNTVAYFDFGPIAAGAFVDFTVEFYISNRRNKPVPRYEAVVQARPLVPLQVAFVVTTNATFFRTNQFYAIFNSERDRFYYVQYSSNLTSTNWTTSLPAIRGTGAGVVWVDTGPPRTDSLPGAEGSRFYRILALP